MPSISLAKVFKHEHTVKYCRKLMYVTETLLDFVANNRNHKTTKARIPYVNLLLLKPLQIPSAVFEYLYFMPMSSITCPILRRITVELIHPYGISYKNKRCIWFINLNFFKTSLNDDSVFFIQ